jgi:hypothetical protein
LEAYALGLLRRNSHLNRVVGIACEPHEQKGFTSETLILVEGQRWSEELISRLEAREAELNIFQKETSTWYSLRDAEFPKVTQLNIPTPGKLKLNRRQRRALKAKQRRL